MHKFAMSVHVSVEVAALRESCIADVAGIRFFSRVRSFVFSEGRAVSKGLATHTTLVRTFTTVCAHVSCH
jgi:hypothetical protein